jgi:hypothetical protein
MVFILALVAAEPQIMLFTFIAGYSLSGPVWLIYRLIHKKVQDGRDRKLEKKYGIL